MEDLSMLMQLVIDAFESVTDIPEGQAIAFWDKLIASFENEGWEGQLEVLGKNPTWDEAYLRRNPYEGGFFSDAPNPYSPGTKEFCEWDRGRRRLLD